MLRTVQIVSGLTAGLKLRESLSNKTTFIAFKISVSFTLISIEPSTTNNVGVRWRGDYTWPPKETPLSD